MNLKGCFYHGVGGHLDYANMNSSYYDTVVHNTRLDNDKVTEEFKIDRYSTQYDVVSLNNLRSILESDGICSRERINYTLPITSASMNSNNTVCISRKGKDYVYSNGTSQFLPAYNFSVRSLSIVLLPETLDYFKDCIMDFDEIRRINPLDISVMYDEYRVLDYIPSKLFRAISVPVTNISDQRFDSLKIYFYERMNEVKIIRELLNEYNLDIPIIDTKTGINLENKVIKKMFR